MRICVLNWRDLAHPSSGGAEVYTEQVLRRWVAQGHEVTLVAAPVHLSERLSGSTVTSTTILRTLSDALTVFGRLHLTPTYRVGVATPARRPALVSVPSQRLADAHAAPEFVLAA